MAGYCTSVRSYFHEPQASENTAHKCIMSHQETLMHLCLSNFNVHIVDYVLVNST